MRIVKSMGDVQKVLNELLDFKQRFESTNIDLKGKRIINAGDSKDPQDYVTRNELQTALKLPTASTIKGASYYTVTFTPSDNLPDGSISPAFVLGIGKQGVPNQFWIFPEDPPQAADLVVNIQYNNVNLLANDVHFPFNQPSPEPVYSSDFIQPVPFLGVKGKLNLVLVNVSGATRINAGLIVRQS